MTHPIPDAALAQHVLIVGMTGSGKTYTAKGLVERMIGEGRRVCVIDPLGVWFGLRLSADGGAGLPVLILGGDHADVPLDDGMGAAVAGLVADPQTPSCILDLSHMTGGGMRRFMTAFAAELYRANRAPLHLVIDEADEFVPQQPMPDAMRMVGELDRIVRRGRARGFRVTMITQRPAVLHKNVVTQAATLVAMRLPAQQDRKAIEGWIKGVADTADGQRVLSALAGMETGQGWVWSPQAGVLELVRFPPIATFDSSRTPEAGHEARTPAPASLDIAAIARRLASNASPAEPEAAPGKGAAGDRERHEAEVKAAWRDGWIEGYMVRQRGILAELRDLARRMDETTTPAQAALAFELRIEEAEALAAAETYPDGPPPAATEAASPAPLAKPASGSGVARMLAVLAARHPARLTRAQLATLAGLSPRSGSFRNYLSKLRGDCMLCEQSHEVWASEKALAQFPERPAPQSAAEVREMWRQALGGGGVRRMFDHLATLRGAAVRREGLAGAVGMSPSSGSFRNYLSALRRNGLLVETKGKVALSRDLFDASGETGG